jgi:hypothetical protein
MILDAKSGLRGVLLNHHTGQRIPFARWANTETGEYEAWAENPAGREDNPPPLLRGCLGPGGLEFKQSNNVPVVPHMGPLTIRPMRTQYTDDMRLAGLLLFRKDWQTLRRAREETLRQNRESWLQYLRIYPYGGRFAGVKELQR